MSESPKKFEDYTAEEVRKMTDAEELNGVPETGAWGTGFGAPDASETTCAANLPVEEIKVEDLADALQQVS